MELAVIAGFALFASALTFFSGFGLGTLLTPVFAYFLPIELAVASTAIVHFLNNLFKLSLIGGHASRQVILKFGLPAIVGAFVGAWLLSLLADSTPLFEWDFAGRNCTVTPVKLALATLIFAFAMLELVPKLKQLQFSDRHLPAGGVLSGFFGGLSGHQGALRSAFLLRCGLTKEAFIATGIVIACFVDVSRLVVYTERFTADGLGSNVAPIAVATGAAFVGAVLGRWFLTKVTFNAMQTVVGLLIVLTAIALGIGLI